METNGDPTFLSPWPYVWTVNILEERFVGGPMGPGKFAHYH